MSLHNQRGTSSGRFKRPMGQLWRQYPACCTACWTVQNVFPLPCLEETEAVFSQESLSCDQTKPSSLHILTSFHDIQARGRGEDVGEPCPVPLDGTAL